VTLTEEIMEEWDDIKSNKWGKGIEHRKRCASRMWEEKGQTVLKCGNKKM
jgi:hypothetical protein